MQPQLTPNLLRSPLFSLFLLLLSLRSLCPSSSSSLRMFSFGEYRAEDQEQMLTALDKKVADVYIRCIGTNEANIP